MFQANCRSGWALIHHFRCFYYYCCDVFHLAKIFGFKLRKLSVPNGKAFHYPGEKPRFWLQTYNSLIRKYKLT